MAAPCITIDHTLPTPAYQQIATRLREAINAGALSAGARLPAARLLAGQFGVARSTADAAYAVLAAEGIIESHGPGGRIVSPHLAARPRPPPQRAMPFDTGQPDPASGPPLPFRMDVPALDAFPCRLWSNLTVRVARRIDADLLALPDPAGYRPLREAIVAWLGKARGITCTLDQVLVTGGFQGALSLAAQVLVRPGDAVWVEDPGYPLARQRLEAAGARLVPVRVDREGLRVAAGMVAAPRARLALVTPTHQSPLSVGLSLPRRLALLAWAVESGAWILEDDYDSPFHYNGHVPPALKSLDRPERVLYAGSFSTLLFPGLRLGYLIVPAELADAFRRANRQLQGGQSLLGQAVTAAFIAEGHFARHLRRMRTLYASRRKALAAALEATFGPRVLLEMEAGGLHLLARFPDGPDDGTLVRRSAAAGLAPTALSSLALAHDCGQGLLLGFTNVPEDAALGLAERLAAVAGPAAEVAGGP